MLRRLCCQRLRSSAFSGQWANGAVECLSVTANHVAQLHRPGRGWWSSHYSPFCPPEVNGSGKPRAAACSQPVVMSLAPEGPLPPLVLSGCIQDPNFRNWRLISWELSFIPLSPVLPILGWQTYTFPRAAITNTNQVAPTTEIYCLRVLEARILKSKCWPGSQPFP